MTTSYVPPTIAELDALAAGAQIVVVISGDSHLSTFAVDDISDGPSLPEARAAMESAGRRFVGLTTLTNGEAQSHLVEPLVESLVWTLSSAVMDVIKRRLMQALQRAGFPAMPELPLTTEKVQ